MRPRRASLALVLVLACAPSSSAQDLPDALRGPFAAGVAALKAGRLEEAQAAFERVLKEGGRAAFVHNNLGIVLQRRERHEEAVAQFREAIRLDPRYAAPRVLLGASLLAQGRAAEAAAALERAVEIAPGEPLARQQLARAYERKGDLPAAVEQYRKLRDAAPNDPDAVYQLGRAYLALAEWSLKRLQDEHPGSARVLQALGHGYRVQGKADRAERAFRRAIEADPALPELHLALAQLYVEQKRWKDARAALERELALVPESAGARALLRQVEAEEGRP
jgi:tetratricopeptide (TPR) repeat protein